MMSFEAIEKEFYYSGAFTRRDGVRSAVFLFPEQRKMRCERGLYRFRECL